MIPLIFRDYDRAANEVLLQISSDEMPPPSIGDTILFTNYESYLIVNRVYVIEQTKSGNKIAIVYYVTPRGFAPGGLGDDMRPVQTLATPEAT